MLNGSSSNLARTGDVCAKVNQKVSAQTQRNQASLAQRFGSCPQTCALQAAWTRAPREGDRPCSLRNKLPSNSGHGLTVGYRIVCSLSGLRIALLCGFHTLVGCSHLPIATYIHFIPGYRFVVAKILSQCPGRTELPCYPNGYST